MVTLLCGDSKTGWFVVDTQNQKGQILVEVLLVSFCLILVFMAGLSQLEEFKKNHYRAQFSKEKSHGSKNPPFKK